MIPFPISENSPVEHSAPLPEQADVVVIGGGIIGVMTAYHVALAGHSVVLLEKGRIAGEQSSRNWGWIRVQGRDPHEIPIMLEARKIWQDLAPRLDTDIGLARSGVTYLADKFGDMEEFGAWLKHAEPYDLSSRLLSKSELSDLMPNAQNKWLGAITTPDDMRAEPWLAAPAFARLAVKAGAWIIENCAARLVDRQAGTVCGVHTEQGNIKTSEVVLAGGAWSSLMLRRLGVNIPQVSVKATAAATDPMPEMFAGGAVDSRFAFRRRQDGGYTLAPAAFHELYIGPDAFRALPRFLRQLAGDPFGTKYLPKAPKNYPDAWGTSRNWSADEISPFEKMRVLNPEPNARKLVEMAKTFGQVFPQLEDVTYKATWGGMIDVMPDVVPVVDRPNAVPGLTICTGMCGHGFGIGPAFGRIAASLATGESAGHDLSRFRVTRFSDGSRLEIGPGL